MYINDISTGIGYLSVYSLNGHYFSSSYGLNSAWQMILNPTKCVTLNYT